MKTLTASKMCMLYCALIVCSFTPAVTTANTSNTTAADTKNNTDMTVSNSYEDSIENREDWTITHPPINMEKTSIEISTTTLYPGTTSVTDLNEFTTEVLSNSTSQQKSDNSNNLSVTTLPTNDVTWSKPNERVTTPVTDLNEFTTEVLSNSTSQPKSDNSNNLSVTTLPTNDVTWSKPKERVVTPVTDLNEFTTEVLSNSTSQPKSDNSNNLSVTTLPTNDVTWSKPKERVVTPVTDLNEFTTEVLSNSTSQPKSDNSNNLSVTTLPTNDVTWSKPKERVTTSVPVTTESKRKGFSKKKKTKWGNPSLSHITHILLSHKSRIQTMEEESKEQLKSPKYKRAKNICIYPVVRKYLKRCQNTAKATWKTKIQEQYENKQQTKVKTSAEIKLKKIEKWKRDQEMLDMDSKRFESILDILN